MVSASAVQDLAGEDTVNVTVDLAGDDSVSKQVEAVAVEASPVKEKKEKKEKKSKKEKKDKNTDEETTAGGTVDNTPADVEVPKVEKKPMPWASKKKPA